jgi:hypothetical protein
MIEKDFFFAIATCTAAIIGIMSAFLITDISNKKYLFKRIIEKVKNLENKSESLKLKSNHLNFEFYNRWIVEFSLFEISNEDFNSVNIDTIGKFFKTPMLMTKDNLSKKLDGIKKNRSNIINEKFITKFYEVSNQITNLIYDIRYNIKEIINLNNEITPFNSDRKFLKYLIFSNITLFLVGVIYPLSFIPFDGRYEIVFNLNTIWNNVFSFSGLLLFCISVIYISIMVYYTFEISKMKYEQNILKDYQKYSDYSPYFINLNNIENGKAN